MYLSRTNNLLDILLFLVLCIGWAAGGWLLVTHAFRLYRGERIVAGLASGFLLFIGLSNLLAHFLSLSLAFWVGSILILLVGAICAWRSPHRPWLEKRDLFALPALLVLVSITLLFWLILKGEAIFDEYLHIPLISTMASGDIPPHFYLNPAFYFAYHYGIQVFAASLVRLADFFPWSAWDLSRALTIAFTLVLGWLWVHRVTRSRLAAWMGTILFTFGGGTRWLLLLLPQPWLNWVSHSVNLVGTGLDTASTLASALTKGWTIEGGGPAAFPFAFHNGIFVPAFFTLGSTGAMPFMTLLLLLLLLPRGRFSRAGLTAWSLLFSTLGLSAEHLFVLVWIGVAIVACMAFIFRKRLLAVFPKDIFYQWIAILLISAVLSVIQGGFITETVRNLVSSFSGAVSQSINARGFSLRWPPGFYSAHLGMLSITNPGQLLALLAELGPALVLVGVIFTRFRKWLGQKDWFTSGLAASALLSMVFPLFFKYGVDRSTTRMPATAAWTSLVLSFPILWMAFRRAKPIPQLGLLAGFCVLILGGAVIFRTQLYSIPQTEYTYYITPLDARYTAEDWNKLPSASQVLDFLPERAVTIFGRITRANSGIYDPLPDWKSLIDNPDPELIAAAGYDYVYMSRVWWDKLTRTQQARFLAPCIDIVGERKTDDGTDYRLLVDVQGCK
jgi:hypothetical protein